MYSGETKFSSDPLETFLILKMSNQLKIDDLKEKCEEDISRKVDQYNVLQLLLQSNAYEDKFKISEELEDKIKSVFIKNFEYIQETQEDIEELIYSQPGLMKKLFLLICSKKKLKRKVTFVEGDLDG